MTVARRILIVRACAIGDFVLNLPALQALALQHSDAKFTLVGYPETLALASLFIPVDSVHSIELNPWSRLFSGPLGNEEIDVGFDAAYVWMRAPEFAQNLESSGMSNVMRNDPFPEPGQHAAAHLLKTIGLPAPELPDLWLQDSSRIVIHPGSGSPTKCWPYFAELAQSIADVTAILGPCETAFKGNCRRIEGLRLLDVAGELRHCRAFIGNDSGITHLAAYLGCPTIALFGPTDPRVWGPVGRRVEVLWKPSLADISADEVNHAVKNGAI